MELNWSTFILEIANFLILVWLLKRFLFKPVLGIVEKRRTEINRSISQAEEIRGEAKVLQQQYDSRLKVWEKEKEGARQELDQEIAALRETMLEQLKAEMEQKRQQEHTTEQRRLEERIKQHELIALRQGALFAGKLLESVADQALEHRLIDLALNELANLPEQQIKSVQQAYLGDQQNVIVLSAFPIEDEQKKAVRNSIRELLDSSVQLRFQTDPQLIAGIRLCAGPWVFHANLQDELKGFVESAHVQI